jgi:hypothetical protein
MEVPGLTKRGFCSFMFMNEARFGPENSRQARRGSLLHRHIRHRTGCAVCASGPGHLVWVLTVSYPGGRTRQFSLSAEQVPMVQQWLRNYRKLKDTLERICELNHVLLRPEK